MKVTAVVENTSSDKNLKAKHGLSFYIQTDRHNIMFDFGPDKRTLQHNMEALHLSAEAVDVAVLSHGHFDHGGGLEYFLMLNRRAKVYIKENTRGKFLSKHGIFHVKIGLSSIYKRVARMVPVKNYHKIDDQLILIGGIEDKLFHSPANDHLEVRTIDGKRKQDDFSHEHNLIVKEGENYFLFCGCGHCGIVNILNRAEKTIGRPFTAVFGGYHLKDVRSIDNELLDAIGGELAKRNTTQFYTCHCTGVAAYERMKKTVGDNMHYISCGESVVF